MAWATSKHKGSTRASRTTRARVLALHPICTCAGCHRCSQQGTCHRASTEDDHITPLHQGGSDDITNRTGLCGPCHGVKSAREGRNARITQTRKTEEHPGLAR